ncbi:MFS general substrate transporter [Aspergillus ellipticus CBS 707.79]|uniref:MFS general substrate transporter n=1 Tax=Aspergillus ellipticus CBS 707.79 TaxID=1448320 RepID=A0A319CZL0_9EURO|nr:MFS general substrate transporter [Aspergillus ellipticus CBS 707.79]
MARLTPRSDFVPLHPEKVPPGIGLAHLYRRWSFYVLIIWTGALLVAIISFPPQTQAEALRKETAEDRWKSPLDKSDQTVTTRIIESIYRPILLLILEPMCLNLCIFSAIFLEILYLFFGAFQLVFGNVYDFTLWQRGCSFLGLLVGMILAILTDPFWRWNYARLERNSTEEKYPPEWRLPPGIPLCTFEPGTGLRSVAIAGAPLVTIGLFIFAWTIYASVHWIGVIIGSAVFGAGTILVYSGIFTFLVDAYPSYAASALAANSFARSSFAGIFPLFGVQMYNRLGYHWATSLQHF